MFMYARIRISVPRVGLSHRSLYVAAAEHAEIEKRGMLIPLSFIAKRLSLKVDDQFLF